MKCKTLTLWWWTNWLRRKIKHWWTNRWTKSSVQCPKLIYVVRLCIWGKKISQTQKENDWTNFFFDRICILSVYALINWILNMVRMSCQSPNVGLECNLHDSTMYTNTQIRSQEISSFILLYKRIECVFTKDISRLKMVNVLSLHFANLSKVNVYINQASNYHAQYKKKVEWKLVK